MPNRAKSIHHRVEKLEGHRRANTRSEPESAGNQTPVGSQYCAICFLTFGSQERRTLWGEKVAHPRCVVRLRNSEAA